MKKLVAFTCLAAAPLVGAGIAHAGSDGGFNLTILPDQLDVGDPGFSLQYDPCTEGDLVEFTILETNATTSSDLHRRCGAGQPGHPVPARHVHRRRVEQRG